MSYSRYPKYKDSGVEWLGEVPEEWEEKPLRYIFTLQTQKGSEQIFRIGLEHIESWTGRFIETESDFQGEGVLFDEGDILFGKLRPYLAKVFLAHQRGEAIGDFHVLHPIAKINGRFFRYLLSSQEIIGFTTSSTFGAKMPRVSWEFMAGLPCAVPNITEQQTIAALLDRETAKIDALIAEQEKLVTLLTEKRQAVISHGVTKGLNPDAPMKDSGVEWLGEVPEGWEEKPLRYIFTLQTQKGSEQTFRIGLEHIESWTGRFIETESDFQGEGVLFGEGDILFGKLRPYLAKVFLACQQGEAVGDFHVLHPITKINGRFFRYLLSSQEIIGFTTSSTFGAKMPRVSWGFMAGLPCAVPNITEQQTIAALLDRETAKIDTLIIEAQNAVALLKERRSALISAAVTGKIDVRNIPLQEAV